MEGCQNDLRGEETVRRRLSGWEAFSMNAPDLVTIAASPRRNLTAIDRMPDRVAGVLDAGPPCLGIYLEPTAGPVVHRSRGAPHRFDDSREFSRVHFLSATPVISAPRAERPAMSNRP